MWLLGFCFVCVLFQSEGVSCLFFLLRFFVCLVFVYLSFAGLDTGTCKLAFCWLQAAGSYARVHGVYMKIIRVLLAFFTQQGNMSSAAPLPFQSPLPFIGD